MNTATAFIYGSIKEGSGCPGTSPEPDLPFEDGDGVCCEAPMGEDRFPCEDCPEDPCDEGIGGGRRSAHGNGEIWWTGYEEPDKPIGDYTAREVGIHGEALAARYLAGRGLEILGQNWRTKAGEVDIIAREPDGEVALIEVKTRLDLNGDPQCMPELAVDGSKQRRYRKLALIYLMCHPEVMKMRFDVIAVNILDPHNARLRHLVSAFSWDS